MISQINDAINKGAHLVKGKDELERTEKDNCLAPIILTGVDHSMDIMQEETFGPVLPMTTFFHR